MSGLDGFEERGDGGKVGEVVPVVTGAGAERGEGVADGRVIGGRQRGDGEAESLPCQGLSDAEADALLASGDEGQGSHGKAFAM